MDQTLSLVHTGLYTTELEPQPHNNHLDTLYALERPEGGQRVWAGSMQRTCHLIKELEHPQGEENHSLQIARDDSEMGMHSDWTAPSISETGLLMSTGNHVIHHLYCKQGKKKMCILG